MRARPGEDRRRDPRGAGAEQAGLESLVEARKAASRGLALFPDSELLRSVLAWLDEETRGHA